MAARFRYAAAAWVIYATGGATAADFFVSPTGNDAHPGSFEQPWRTIQHAANVAPAGSTVNVRAGVYSELVIINVSGNATDGPIRFRSMPGEMAIVDGTGLTVPASESGLFFLDGRDWITIEGFTLRDLSTGSATRVPVAIHVRGNADHITLRGNVIHDIRTTNINGNAHAIAVYGDATNPCESLVIEENEIYDCALGFSEAMVVNGNVDGFVIEANYVHHCDNIGIDVIGGEGTAPNPELDVARNGRVTLNLVHDIDSGLNPAYAGERSAGGIYVDGGCCIDIDRNTVHHANLGIELASERAGWTTHDVTVTNNVIHNCHVAGLGLGGYDTSVGGAADCTVVNNTFYRNDSDATGSGELMLQHAISGCVIRNNIFNAGTQAVLVSNPFAAPTSTQINNNQWYAPGGAGNAQFMWANVDLTGFNAWKSASGQDSQSSFGIPQFVAGGSVPDLHLQASSPCINSGATSAIPAGIALDRDGRFRVAQSSVDRGAYEFGSLFPMTGDLDGDGAVNASDLAELLGGWGACNSCAADLNGDGVVNAADLSILLGAWSV